MSSDDNVYDLCIIGAGLFGTAAARHASANPTLKVCLIGPDEPLPDEKKYRQIFGAHYDESRLIFSIDNENEIRVLSRQTFASFRELERISGITFHHPVGMLTVGQRHSRWIEICQKSADKRERNCIVNLTPTMFQRRFPYLKLKDNEVAILDDTGAGYMNPRKIIAAETKVAGIQGCMYIEDIVRNVRNQDMGVHQILTKKHGTVVAKRVLICTGAFTNFNKFDVLPLLQVTAIKKIVALVQVSQEEAERLSSMPSMIYRTEGDLLAYILPPILYPNGFHYLKISPTHTDYRKQALHNLDSVINWYREGDDPELVDKSSKIIAELIPGLNVDKVEYDTCVTCVNSSNLPFIDRISPTVTVAMVGNNKGAMICDEVGRLAAHLSLTGQWDSELPRSLFHALTAEH